MPDKQLDVFAWFTALGAGGVITTFVGWVLGRRKTNAEAAKIEAEAAEAVANASPETRLHKRIMEGLHELLDEQRKIIEQQSARITEAVASIDAMSKEVRTLTAENVKMGREIRLLRSHIDMLLDLLKANNIEAPDLPTSHNIR